MGTVSPEDFEYVADDNEIDSAFIPEDVDDSYYDDLDDDFDDSDSFDDDESLDLDDEDE